jgi:hypothetical protein
MKYIRIEDTFIELSGKIFSVKAVNATVTELNIGDSDPHASATAFLIAGAVEDIVDIIQNFLEKSQKFLVLERFIAEE